MPLLQYRTVFTPRKHKKGRVYNQLLGFSRHTEVVERGNKLMVIEAFSKAYEQKQQFNKLKYATTSL